MAGATERKYIFLSCPHMACALEMKRFTQVSLNHRVGSTERSSQLSALGLCERKKMFSLSCQHKACAKERSVLSQLPALGW